MRKDMRKTNATARPETKAIPSATAILPKVAKPQTSPIKRIKDWWGKHFGTLQARKSTAKSIAVSIDHATLSFIRAMKVNLLLALVAMLVVHFCPEIADICPVFLQLCEGILVFYEFVLRAVFTILKALIQTITLDWAGAGDSMSAMFAEGGRLVSMLIDWLQAITF